MASPAVSYQLDTTQIDIEALAQRQVRYLRVTALAAEHMKGDPVRRDRLFAEMQNHPQMQPTSGPQVLVPLGQNPDSYLDAVDAKLDVEPTTFEDHMLHIHYAFGAMSVFMDYKVLRGLGHAPKLQEKLQLRISQMFDKWLRETLAPSVGYELPPPSAVTRSRPSTSARNRKTPARGTVTQKDILIYQQTPRALLGKKFIILPGGEGEMSWEVLSYTESAQCLECNILFDGCDGSINMPFQDVCDLLLDSFVATA